MLIVAAALAVVMSLFAWLATVVRRRGLAGSGFLAVGARRPTSGADYAAVRTPFSP
ncbi:hypothetical protein ACWGBH_26415 [Streptomyces massasporeus]